MEKLVNQNFSQKVEECNNKVVVRFYTDWCPDCVRTKPGSQELALEYQDRFNFFTVNIDDDPELAARFNVKGIPTIIVFDHGKEVDRLWSRDAKTKEQISKFVQKQTDQV